MPDRSSEFFDPNSHARFCPVKHTRSALFIVVYFSLAALADWRGLHKGPSQPDLTLLLFAILVFGMLAKMMVDFTCFRERVAFGIAMLLLSVAQVERYAPWVFGTHLEMEKSVRLVLSLLGLVVSLTMLVQALTYSAKNDSGLD
jgi:hypothetical protein